MSWLRRLRDSVRPSRLERDIEREMSFHIAERIDELRAQGVPPDEARRRAHLQFGNVPLQRERTRDMNVSLVVDARLRDIRHAVRSLARRPGFTVTVVLTLALGMGANAAVFAALDAVVLRPLAFPEGDQLMRLQEQPAGGTPNYVAPLRLADWDRLNTSFQAITGYYMEDVSDTSGDVPERVRRAWVAPRFLDVWRVLPAIGRGFNAEEHLMGGPRAVLVSHRYWQMRMGGTPDVLMRSVKIGASSTPIVGVMPRTFLFPERDIDLWFPAPIDAPYAQSRRAPWYTVVGRLKEQVTADEARANLNAVQAQLGQDFPDTDRDLVVQVTPLKDEQVGGMRASLWLLFGAVSVLLLITCVNVAAMLLSRATQRRHEMTLRMSLGAGRSTIVAQVLTETTLLALAGGALGMALAAMMGSAFRIAAADLPRIEETAISGRVLAYTLASSLFVALASALVPAMRAGREDSSGGLKDGGRTQVSGRHALQWTLVGLQVALSVALLVSAGLLVRSFQALSHVDAGFDPANVLTFRVSGSFAETRDDAGLTRRIETTLEDLAGMSGVEAAATAMTLPGLPFDFERRVLVAEDANADHRILADHRVASPEYFATLRIPLVSGVVCRRTTGEGTGEILVNQAFADRYLTAWPSPIGLHLADVDEGSSLGRIVGVVGNAREQGLDREPRPTVYVCLSTPGPTPYFLLRTSREPADAAQAIRLRMKEVEPLRSVYDIAPLQTRIDEYFTENRLRSIVIALFAAAAVVLAGIGLYGTLSYVIGLRRREIGLRFALGAGRGTILAQLIVGVLKVVGAGAVAGIGLALATSRFLAGMLYGVSPSDPLTIAGVVTAILVIGALAAAGPAVRAARFDPSQVLRGE